jgi:hypothetical protein
MASRMHKGPQWGRGSRPSANLPQDAGTSRERDEPGARRNGEDMEVLWAVLALGAYVVMMRWILPRLGVST